MTSDLLARIDRAVARRNTMLHTPAELRPSNWGREYKLLNEEIESLWVDVRHARAGIDLPHVDMITVYVPRKDRAA